MKYAQVNDKEERMTSLTYFTGFFSVFIDDLEQLIVCLDKYFQKFVILIAWRFSGNVSSGYKFWCFAECFFLNSNGRKEVLPAETGSPFSFAQDFLYSPKFHENVQWFYPANIYLFKFNIKH